MPDEEDEVMQDSEVQLVFYTKKRERIFAQIQEIFDISSKVAPGTVSGFLARCNELDRIRDTFEVVQDHILELNLQVVASKAVEIDKVTTAFNEIYWKIRTIERDLNKFVRYERPEEPRETSTLSEIRLPKIDVPTWDGDLGTFENFWAMFHTLVHESKLSNVVKMTYLKRALSGSPLKLIQNLNNVNYSEAYNLIDERYNNPRSLATFYVEKMLSFPPLHSPSLSNLQSFLDVFNTTVSAYNNLELEDHNDYVLFQCAFRTLPSETRILFERSLKSRTIPSFQELIQFVEDQCKIEELTRRVSTPNILKSSTSKTPSLSKRNPQSLIVTPDAGEENPPPRSSTPSCPYCQGVHSIYGCKGYSRLPLNGKYDWLRQMNRCFRCLGTHNRQKCSSQGKCDHCNSGAHHSSLHKLDASAPNTNVCLSLDPQAPPTPETAVDENDSLTLNTTGFDPARTSLQTLLTGLPSVHTTSRTSRTVLLGTVQALIRNKWGKMEPIRLVIDSGSQICLISAECAQRLALPVFSKETNIDGALSQNLGTSKGIVSCTLSSRYPSSRLLTTEAVVVRRVCSNLPTVSLPDEVYKNFAHLQLADMSFCNKGKIDFLLGASLYTQIFESDCCSIIQGQPSAFETMFGWVIMGNVTISPAANSPHVSLLTCEVDLDRTLQGFWKCEEVTSRNHRDPMHNYAEEHFQKTHSRKSDGSYVVRLPFKPDIKPNFVQSKEIARRRWINLERRLRKDTKFRNLYHLFMQEYLDLDHMEHATSPGLYYIPHFGILRDSPTSPLRVVFDASCSDANGTSLNDCLLVGPPLQKDIGEIVTTFRLNAIALITDIKMMYRKIWLHPDDSQFQHVLWRENEDSPLEDFQLRTLTYGLSSSPFLAQRTLKQLVMDEGDKFPLASRAILESCYMDDLCTSVASEQEAHRLKDELNSLMGLGGFELRKWASNSQYVLQDIPKEHQLPSLSLNSRESMSLHVLGLEWVPTHDIFTYNVKPLGHAGTKREVLSRIASIFDPLGWVGPVIFKSKLFLREIWTRSLEWDTPLPPDLCSRWAEFSSEFATLSQVKLPRLLVDVSLPKFHLVGFCDASSQGYAAVLYLRCSSINESSVHSNIVCSKTRVAPLKVLTIPRLELNAALLLAQLVDSMQPLIRQLGIKDVTLLSDSTVVLGWLSTSPHRLHTFVANRVVSILELSERSQWHHVSTSLNVADVASRGLLPSEIVDHPSWWAGPNFLRDPIDTWPLNQCALHCDLPEMKPSAVSMPVVQKVSKVKEKPFVITLIEKHSSYSRLKRVLAWVLRFIHNTRQRGTRGRRRRRFGVLQPSELQDSAVLCVKATQRHYFTRELRALEKGRPLPPALRRLTPFVQNGLLRVGGRLTHSLLNEGAKHPLLLPKDAYLSSLICDAYHKTLLHAGPQATQAAICQEFWILSVRGLLRQRIFRCLQCYKYRLKEDHPIMADLPASRVTPCSPFARTAVDFCGPLLIKQSSRRNAPSVKAYICVFVCMVTKAVHLELASSLSSDCFIGALSRFVARRGLCKEIYSDNGTNFHGAASNSREILDFLRSSHPDIANHLSERHIVYHFNPPESPWMGGLWEAAVKATKHHLRHISIRLLTYEEMSTVLARIEAILNSRPLYPLGDSPDSIYLSPAHFLIGRSLTAPLEYDFSSTQENHLSHWQHVQQVSQRFWKLWSKNYLHTLMERKKWTKDRPPLQEGDVVIIMRQNSRPLEWPLGKIVELHPGIDGVARSATLRTAQGTLVRPIARLAPLPVEGNAQ